MVEIVKSAIKTVGDSRIDKGVAGILTFAIALFCKELIAGASISEALSVYHNSIKNITKYVVNSPTKLVRVQRIIYVSVGVFVGPKLLKDYPELVAFMLPGLSRKVTTEAGVAASKGPIVERGGACTIVDVESTPIIEYDPVGDSDLLPGTIHSFKDALHVNNILQYANRLRGGFKIQQNTRKTLFRLSNYASIRSGIVTMVIFMIVAAILSKSLNKGGE